MARPLRLEFPGALYHVTARGNARQDIFFGDADHAAFLDVLAETCAHQRWRCHAYCLMTNHYHLVVETEDANLSHGMRQINGVYTQNFNRRHGRVGHLLQGRYKAILVDKEGYLKELARYVVLNPVRAGLVGRPEDWRWSSYRATAGEVAPPVWLETDWLLSQLAGDRQRARAVYKDFVREGRGMGSPWNQLRQQIYLGLERFVEEMQRRLEPGRDLSEVPGTQRRHPPKPLASYASTYSERHEAMVQAYRSGAYSQAEIARHFGVHYSTVSRALRRREGAAG